MIILWNNEIDKNTYTALTEHVDYPLTNLIDPRLSRVYHSLSDDDQYILIAGTDIKADAIAILNHNISSGATIRIQGNDADVWGAPTFNQLLTWAEYILFQEFTSGEYDYWRLFVDDPANPDGYIKIGRLYLGEVLEMPGMKPDQEIDDQITDKVDFSESGQVYSDEGIDFREYIVNFPYCSEIERIAIRDCFKNRRFGKPLVMSLWPGDTRELPMYCVFTAPPKWKRTDDFNYLWQIQFSFRETF